jgi:2-dehydro-3-deoxyphosphogluconate aldolase/(4S)-4-hydroxy-2-oxoglutarate aldolase
MVKYGGGSLTKDQVRDHIEKIGIIPSIRVPSPTDAIFAAEAIADGGIPILEVTTTVPGAIGVISELTRRNPELIVGAGTVWDIKTARQCLDAGATFLMTPGLDGDLVEFGIKEEIVVIPCALTPAEIVTAWKSGADFVKIFPCSVLGGADYVRALKALFPHVPLIAAGGVNQETAADFIDAGAVALGIGRDLVHADAVENRDGAWIRGLSRQYLRMVRDARDFAAFDKKASCLAVTLNT